MPSSEGGGDPSWILDRMNEEDIARVLVIEKASFSSPWPRGAFLEELRSNPYARCMVVRESTGAGRSILAAYICYWILGEELLINNLAVDAGRRRHGLGRLLLVHAMEEAVSAGCRQAWLEVRASNDAARHLYESHGFRAVRRRKKYYSDTGEDALEMVATLKALETG